MENAVDRLAIPPALLAQVRAMAEEKHRSAEDTLNDVIERGMREIRKETLSPETETASVPLYVQERAAALGLGNGTPRRLVRKVSEMSREEIEAIAKTEMDPRHNYLNAELE